MRPLTVPCGAIRMPCRSAYSAIHFSSARPPTSQGSGPTMRTACRLDQLLEVLAQVDLLAGVDRRRGRGRDLAIDVGIDVRAVVAGDQVLEPQQVERLDRPGEPDRVGHRPARPAIERQADVVAEHFLHRLDAGDDVLQPLSVRARDSSAPWNGPRLRRAVVEVGHLALHAAVEADPLLHDGEPLRQGLHLPAALGVILGLVGLERQAHGAVIDPHLVAHLAAEELVDRQPGRLAGDVPERHLDRR